MLLCLYSQLLKMTTYTKFVKCSRLLQNFSLFQKMPYATAAYQFKINKPIYYPDRRSEMQRMEDQQKSQLVAEKKEKIHLPRDHHYKVLGLNRHATTQEIKAAYYGLAKRFHPDSANPSNVQQVSKRFQEISNAYHILTNESTRQEYDQLGLVKDENEFLQKANTKAIGKEIKVNATGLLRAVGNRSKTHSDTASTVTAAEDIRLMPNTDQKLEISFLESVHGVKRNIDLKYLKKCPQCNGSSQRMAGRISPEPCRKCNGNGQVQKKTATYTSMVVCNTCNGKRFINRNQCDMCDCRGFVQESSKITIHVPAGVKTGDVIAVENPKANQKHNYRIIVQESDYYQRVGNNVITENFINISDAILGATIKIRGIYDTLDVKIEPGTESHTKVTLKGKGIKVRGDGDGDHIVLLKVKVPRNLSMKQRQLILAFAKTEDPSFER